MPGILAFGAYIPYHRILRKAIAEAFGERGAAGEKAVANADEDSLTMAVAASLDCLAHREQLTSSVKAVYYATTTPAYAEKQGSVLIAAVLDLPTEIRTTDVSHSLRASSSALLAAFDQVKGNETALVATADTRLGAAQSPAESYFGDGGAAFLVGGGEGVIANLIASHSTAEEQIGQWRLAQEPLVRQWEERFVNTVTIETTYKAVQGLLQKSSIPFEEINKVVIPAGSARVQMDVARSLGLQKEQVVDGLDSFIGHTGVAYGAMMLISALEQAQPGEKILYIGYGEGCDALLFEVTEQIKSYKKSKGIEGHLQLADNSLPYMTYAKWKGLLSLDAGRRPEAVRPSVPAMHRNRRKNLALCGATCTSCGTKQFPAQRICAVCQAKDSLEEYRFVGKTAKIATYTTDYLAASLTPPTNIAVIDFDEGGRVMLEVTDCKPEDLQIGKPVEMTFRRLYQAGGIHNYFWKARPKR